MHGQLIGGIPLGGIAYPFLPFKSYGGDLWSRAERGMGIRAATALGPVSLGVGKLNRRRARPKQAGEYLTSAMTMFREMGMGSPGGG